MMAEPLAVMPGGTEAAEAACCLRRSEAAAAARDRISSVLTAEVTAVTLVSAEDGALGYRLRVYLLPISGVIHFKTRPSVS